jgi:hypothetical protein
VISINKWGIIPQMLEIYSTVTALKKNVLIPFLNQRRCRGGKEKRVDGTIVVSFKVGSLEEIMNTLKVCGCLISRSSTLKSSKISS